MSPFIRAKKSIGEKGSQAKEKSVLETTPTESDIINTESEALTNEGTSEGAGIHLRRGSERNDGSYPEEQVQGLESRPGTNRTRGEGSRPADGEAANLVNEGREVRVAELGILNGSKTQTVRLVDANKETKLMKKARKDAESRGLKIKFFVGDNIIITEKTGEISSVRAYVLGDTMLIRADHPVYTADQLERHEAGHKRIERGEINLKDVRKRLEEIVGKKTVEGVAEAYAELYAGTGMDAEEIWEECICDFLGDMNIFSKSANGSLVVNELIKQTQAIVKEQKAEPNQTRGSPEQKNTANSSIEKKSIDTEFNNIIDNWDKKTIGFSFVVGETSEALQEAGIPKKQIRWDASKIVALLNKHNGMTIDTIKQIPELLEHPIIVVDSKKDVNSKIVMGDLYDANGKIVTAVLLLTPTSKKGNVLDLIKISSAEGRGHIKSLFTYEDGSNVPVRYINKKRIQSWLNVNRLQLPLHNLDSDSNNIISQKTDLSTQNSKIVPEGKASRELDTEYLSAVERGDMKAAQRMVDEAAKNWGAISLKDNKPTTFYHGTNKEFNVFSYGEIGKATGVGILGEGFYFTDKQRLAKDYGQNVKSFYLQMSNPYIATENDFGRLRSDKLADEKYDGVILKTPSGNITMVFDNTQMKLTDPVTYDDDGNVIPLSERFNPEKKDIRYSREPFSRQVDDVLNGADTSNTHLKIMDTPKLLQDAGLPNLPILMTAKHLKTITQAKGKDRANYHGLDVQIIKNLPEYIDDPVIIADSLTRDDSIVIITEAIDKENRPVIAAIMLNGKGNIDGKYIDANIMTSAYGRNNFQNFINNIADENAVIYWNKNKSQELSVNLGIQFPNIITRLDSNTIIRKAKAFVNTNSKNNFEGKASRELDALDYVTPADEFEAVDEMAFSNRTLLANALLDTITSSEEYKLIRSYQEEIAGLDKSDKRLAQLKKDRNQLYKQEKPNFEVIRELNEKIKTLEAEIVNRDKRLLRLESTTALKNVLERARKD